jgi:hypothetical protein
MAAPRRVGLVNFGSARRPRGRLSTRARATAEDLTRLGANVSVLSVGEPCCRRRGRHGVKIHSPLTRATGRPVRTTKMSRSRFRRFGLRFERLAAIGGRK